MTDHRWLGQRVIRYHPPTLWQRLLRRPATIERGTVIKYQMGDPRPANTPAWLPLRNVIRTDDGKIHRGDAPHAHGWDAI